MELDLTSTHREAAYAILAGLVTPRPIALVSTIDIHGRVNAAPFSFFNVLGANPPIVGICPGDREPGVPKDTAANISATLEFVVNLVDEDLGERMNLCAASLPPGVSELEHAGLTAVASSVVKPPRIGEAPASLECVSRGTIEIGHNRLIIGEVLRVHVREGIFNTETWRIDPADYHPLGRMQSPNWYCRTKDMFMMNRPG
ncbi:flavin reductase family protein [Luteolibacter pohnpeiensis]|uniref:Flavin reductase family protein n=2 Tax=Luteolibacter pohnpeiensis TaxID=454153 RepID=A0A934SBM8_9BACT|nr:flavin reductase family protein [Luteolibacter pohnpeiensis]